MLNTHKLQLRALEKKDLELLYQSENDTSLWKYADRTEFYSENLLEQFIEKQHLDIYQTKQKRFVITSFEVSSYGFVDLFDFDPIARKAGVGLLVFEKYRNSGVATQSLILLEEYVKKFLNLHQLYANVTVENKISIRLFEKVKYRRVGTKKDWRFFHGKFYDEILFQKIFL